jgi:hypothetical protein
MLTMKALLPVTMIAILAAGSAFAECTAPKTTLAIPNGSKATLEEMVAAQRAIKALNVDMTTFTACVQAEQEAELAAGGDKLSPEAHDKIVSRYATHQNSEVDKLQKLADKFNTELKAYRAKHPS